MSDPHMSFGRRLGRTVGGLLLVGLIPTACSLPIKPPSAQETYRLNPVLSLQSAAITTAQGQPREFLLQMRPITAANGFETSAMMYSRQAQVLQPYRDNRWLAPPADLLTDAMAQTLTRQPWVMGVVPNSAGASVALSVSCDLTRLEHDMTGSSGQVRLALNCLWLDPAAHAVRGHWRFDQTAPVTQNDAAHFAAASQQLVDQVITGVVRRTRQLLLAEPNTGTLPGQSQSQ